MKQQLLILSLIAAASQAIKLSQSKDGQDEVILENSEEVQKEK